MPAFTLPSSSSVSSSYQSFPTSAVSINNKKKTSGASSKSSSSVSYRQNVIPTVSSSGSMSSNHTEKSSPIRGGGSFNRVDTRQVALGHLHGNRRSTHTNTKQGSSPTSSVTGSTPNVRIRHDPSSPVSTKDSVEDVERKLKHNLLRFALNGDRRLICRTLQNCTFLQNIPIKRSSSFTVSYPPMDQLEKLAAVRPIELNEMILGGNSLDSNNLIASSNSVVNRSCDLARRRGWDDLREITFVVREVCSRLARNPEVCNGPTEDQLYHAMLVRLSKLQSAHDSHTALISLLATPPDLNLLEPKKPWKPLGISRFWVYASDGHIHCVCKTQHAYGLFRKSDPVNRPWIGLTATVHERINLTTGASVDRISLQVHEDKYSL